MEPIFQNRYDAGRKLADFLIRFARREDVLVLALPRGGVPVAFEVAKRLGARMDVFLVRKLGVPGHAELAMGAVAPGGVVIRNDQVVEELGISETSFAEAVAREQAELRRREQALSDHKPAFKVEGMKVILVDDGLATGATMQAAIMALRKLNPERIVVAVPVGSVHGCGQLRQFADEVVCLYSPWNFLAVGEWYRDFTQTDDEEVRDLLKKAGSVNPVSDSLFHFA